MLCGGCKHWGTPDDGGGEFRVCRAAVHDESSLTTDFAPRPPWLVALLGPEPDPHAAERPAFRAGHRAVVQDREGYHAELRTRSDFGCVLFEPR